MSVALSFPQRVELASQWHPVWAAGCAIFQNLSSPLQRGQKLEVSPEADSPSVHMRPLAHFLPLLPALVGRVPVRKEQGTAFPTEGGAEREGVLVALTWR